jgi:hypothetical protein
MRLLQWHRMSPNREDALRALRDAAVSAAGIRVELDAAYLRAIAIVESLDTNQSGSDKTWLWSAQDAFRRHYQNVKGA